MRYKATIRSTALTLTPTNFVQLTFPAKSGADDCLRPMVIRLAVFGTPIGPLHHASLTRRSILDLSVVSNVTKALVELLNKTLPSSTENEIALEVLMSIIGSTKNAATLIVQHSSFPDIINNGLLRTTSCSVSSTVALVFKILEIAPKTKHALLAVFVRLLNDVVFRSVSPQRVADFFEVFTKIQSSSVNDSVVCSLACRSSHMSCIVPLGFVCFNFYIYGRLSAPSSFFQLAADYLSDSTPTKPMTFFAVIAN